MKKFTTFLLQQKIGKVCNDFYVNTYYLLEELKPYEVNLNQLCKKYKIAIPKELKDTNKDSFWVNINTELITLLEENNIFEEVKIDNTYNIAGKINHNICFVIYKNKKNDKYYVEISVHLGGDIRGNYTDSVVYEFEYETEIYDFLLENSKKYYISYKGINYGIEVNAIKENVEVFGGKYGEFDIISKYDICRENVKQYIQEYIDKRNSLLKIGTEIEIFDMKDKEKLENVYYDKSYQDIVIYRVEKIIRDVLVVSSKDNPIIKVRIRKNDLFKIEEG